MKRLKKITGILLITALALAGTACGKSDKTTKSEDSTKELKKVIIATTGLDGSMTESAAIAQKEKFFEEELEKVGYYPEYQAFAQAGPAINEAFASKSIDFAAYGDLPAITAKSNGIDIKIIATTNSSMKYSVVVRSDLDITSISDLQGKKLVVGYGTAPYKYFSDLLEKNELTVDDVEVVNSSTDGPTMLPAKQADAFVTSYGPALLYQANGIGTIFETEEDDDLASLFVIAGRSEYIEKNPEAAEAIVKALERAYEFAQENPEKVYEDLATDSFPIEIQKQAYSDSSFESFNPVIDSVVEERAEDMISFLKSNNLITNDVDVSEILDTSVYEKALQK